MNSLSNLCCISSIFRVVCEIVIICFYIYVCLLGARD